MELIYGLLAGGVTGLVGGYVLATHIHSIADAAAARISAIGAPVAAPAPTTVVNAAPAATKAV